MSNVPHNNLPEAQTAGGAVANPDDDNPYAAYGEQATGGASSARAGTSTARTTSRSRSAPG